jgi:two-component system response regulator FixJ
MGRQVKPSDSDIALSDVNPIASRPVYVIDDDSIVRQALHFALESKGFTPRSFRSGQDFLDDIDHLSVGCVILDLRMPNLDGLDVLRRLGDRIIRFPVIVITGHGDIPDAVAAMKLGATDFLEKPFADDELATVIDGAWNRLSLAMADENFRQAAADGVARLTPREKEVVQGLLDGLPNKLIALRLKISQRTVEVHRRNLMSRLAAGSVSELTRMALAVGMKPSSEQRQAGTP